MADTPIVPESDALTHAALMFVACLVCVSVSVGAQDLPAQTRQPLTLINWNTYHFFDYRAHTDAAAAWLSERAPSIVVLQELVGIDSAALADAAGAWGHPHVVMHKESGYPVALTSTEPIEVVRRQVEGFHHGYLHARTHGVDILVVHFWPSKPHEAEQVAAYARELVGEGRRLIVAGDFNGVARADEPYLIAREWEGRDYAITDSFLTDGFVDLVQVHEPDDDYSFGAPALIPRWAETLEEVHAKRHRIDYVLADPETAAWCEHADIVTDDETVGLWSDHYPIVVRLDVPPESAEADAP